MVARVETPPPKPPLKWAGGKRWQVPHLQTLWAGHSHRRLVEPFCGGLAVALGLQPERALLNDLNPHVINFYQWVKRGLVITRPMANSPARYYVARDRFNDLLGDGQGNTAEAAGLFYYLNRTGYNGLCRFNRRGRFNVPFGRYARIHYRREFPEYRAMFGRWGFTHVAFEQLPLQPDDFVYADPPYDVPFTQYSTVAFDWAQQVRTAEWLTKHPGPVVLSNQATARILDLYETLGFDIELLEAPRRISCTGDRTPATEVIAMRNLGAIAASRSLVNQAASTRHTKHGNTRN